MFEIGEELLIKPEKILGGKRCIVKKITEQNVTAGLCGQTQKKMIWVHVELPDGTPITLPANHFDRLDDD